MADILVMAVVLAYCGLVIYWKKTGVLGDSCGGSCGSGGCSGCGGCLLYTSDAADDV